jgi:hypothetical protein
MALKVFTVRIHKKADRLFRLSLIANAPADQYDSAVIPLPAGKRDQFISFYLSLLSRYGECPFSA